MTVQYQELKEAYLAEQTEQGENMPHVFGYIDKNDNLNVLSLELTARIFNNRKQDIKEIMHGWFSKPENAGTKMVFFFSETWVKKVKVEDYKEEIDNYKGISNDPMATEGILVYEESPKAIKSTMHPISYSSDSKFRIIEEGTDVMLAYKGTKDYDKAASARCAGFLNF